PVYGFPTQGYWIDIGTPAAYLKLNLDGLRGKFPIVLPGHKVSEGVWAGENCRIHRTARLTGPVVIGDSCTIGPQARIEGPVVMGSGCAIEESAVVEESVLWDTVHVGGRSTVSHSILGTESSIGDGVWVIEGSVIGDRVVVGDSNRIERGMAVWPDRTLEPSTISFVRPS
ncbi:MAG: NDP-sugar synthase, partial [Chloroflexi bacterium]|nr:NDP-sugar synthase [Chloroflexota bacterium]